MWVVSKVKPDAAAANANHAPSHAGMMWLSQKHCFVMVYADMYSTEVGHWRILGFMVNAKAHNRQGKTWQLTHMKINGRDVFTDNEWAEILGPLLAEEG